MVNFRFCLTAAFAVTAGLILSGCAPDLSNYSDVRAELDFETGIVSYPIESYALVGVDAITVEQANSLLIQDCMQESGLDFPRASQDWKAKSQQPDRTFGLWSPIVAATTAYDVPAKTEQAKLEAWEADQPDSWWTEYWQCLDTSNQLPDMSLLVGNPNEPTSVDRGYSESLKSTQSSEAFTDAQAEWKACIAKEGLTAIKGPILVPVLPESAESRFEIALKDVKCKEDLGTMQRIADVFARYQAAYIDSHEGELTSFRDDARDVLAEARQIVATYGG